MKHTHIFPVSLLAALLILGAVYLVWYRAPSAASVQSGIVAAATTPPVAQSAPSTTGTTKKTTYTLAEIALHNTKSSCWTTINGGVYDVTSWIAVHPGGASAIVALCGIDGSDAFNRQHGGQGRPATELKLFEIGALQN